MEEILFFDLHFSSDLSESRSFALQSRNMSQDVYHRWESDAAAAATPSLDGVELAHPSCRWEYQAFITPAGGVQDENTQQHDVCVLPTCLVRQYKVNSSNQP